uniref:Uncharacterized protein n=1 Tax=Rhizophora mucronata TaxID=61149 RepID=A0A2P2N7I6_RHIMU
MLTIIKVNSTCDPNISSFRCFHIKEKEWRRRLV